MMDAQLRLPITKEQDIPAPPLSPIAHSRVDHSVGAQQRTFLLPPTPNATQTTTERQSSIQTVQTYEKTPMQEFSMLQTPASRPSLKAISKQSNSKPPKEPPAIPIPPKPPDLQQAVIKYGDLATTKTCGNTACHSPHHSHSLYDGTGSSNQAESPHCRRTFQSPIYGYKTSPLLAPKCNNCQPTTHPSM